MNRFDIIEHCSTECAVLIDRENELISIPLRFSLNDLDDEDKKRLGEWLDYLNEEGS